MREYVHWCRTCRRCRPLSQFATPDAHKCNECKAATPARIQTELSPAQTAVADLMCLGKTNEEIGAILNRSPLTVKAHVQGILRKLDANNRTYAAVLYTVKKIKESI